MATHTPAEVVDYLNNAAERAELYLVFGFDPNVGEDWFILKECNDFEATVHTDTLYERALSIPEAAHVIHFARAIAAAKRGPDHNGRSKL